MIRVALGLALKKPWAINFAVDLESQAVGR